MSLNDREISTLLTTHAQAISQLTLSNVEKLIYDLKGNNQPDDKYAQGYRDAIDTMLIRLRQLAINLDVQYKKGNTPNE